MESLNVIAPPVLNGEKSDIVKSNQQESVVSSFDAVKQRKYFSIHSFLNDQLVPILIAGLLSFAVYNYSSLAQFRTAPPHHEATSSTQTQSAHDMKLIYEMNQQVIKSFQEQTNTLRDETRGNFERISGMIQTKQEPSKPVEIILVKPPVTTTQEPRPTRLYMADVQKEFDMQPFDDMIVDPAFEAVLDSYDITADPFYIENKEELELTALIYEDRLLQPSIDDQRMYLEKGDTEGQALKLHAAINLPFGEFLGTFAGVISDHADDILLTWKYRATTLTKSDGTPLELIIDGKTQGNWFHFLPIADEGNVEAFFIPFNNMWYIGFRTTRAISAGEELILVRDP